MENWVEKDNYFLRCLFESTKNNSQCWSHHLVVFFTREGTCLLLTRYWSAKSNEGNGVDAVLEINKASQVSCDISDNGRAKTNGTNGHDKGWVAVEDSCKIPQQISHGLWHKDMSYCWELVNIERDLMKNEWKWWFKNISN